MAAALQTRLEAPGRRFAFGKNWARFLRGIDEDRIRAAERSLTEMLQLDSLEGLSFLDVGCGSGLFSLAARRLGARVRSFDSDPQSVSCARALRQRFFPDDPEWRVEDGSALDLDYLGRIGRHDVVYSWGVLHHTGDLWQALGNVTTLVNDDGRLFVAIYNDQGAASRRWRWVKQQYNVRAWARPLLLAGCFVALYGRPLMSDLLRGRPFQTLVQYGRERGMSVWTDLADWTGGYPFEVAKPEELFDFYRARGFHLLKMATRNDLGCNEMIFQLRQPTDRASIGSSAATFARSTYRATR